ncbi:MAG: hypothetical protein IPI61_11665 [Syntrophaceae bacterium]|jgi:hypothetical protein|nr:hypothetical protein [Syntrophaceae bacterium]
MPDNTNTRTHEKVRFIKPPPFIKVHKRDSTVTGRKREKGFEGVDALPYDGNCAFDVTAV